MVDWSPYATGGAAGRADSFTGLEPEFAANVYRLLQAAHAAGYPLQVTSAYRSPELQATLYQNAIKKYGSPEAARKWVAPPGRSQHNFGRAVDLTLNNALLRDANSPAARWVKENAQAYGVTVPMSWEPWQVEPIGARSQPYTPTASQPRISTQGGAAPMDGQPQPAAPRGLLGLFGPREDDPRSPADRRRDILSNLAIGLSGLSMFPNTAMINALQGGIEERRETRKEALAAEKALQSKSRTVEWLRSQGREDLAAAVEAGALDGKSAAGLAFEKREPTRGITVGDRIINPVTGEVIYEPDPASKPALTQDQLSAINTIRDDVRVELAPFREVESGYKKIMEFYNNPGSTSDYALVVSFAKILDPGSVAREGEVAAVQNAGAKVPALGQALRNALTGEGSLTPAVRREIADLAAKIYAERASAAQVTLESYGRLAEQAGVPAEFIYSGQITAPMTIPPGAPPPAPPGVDPATWPSVWANMTDDERRAFMGGTQ